MSMWRNNKVKCPFYSTDEQVVRTLTFRSNRAQPATRFLEQGACVDSPKCIVAATGIVSIDAIPVHLSEPNDPITPTSPNPKLQFTPSFAPAATPCELHPTSAHPPHSTSHHRECCPPVRLTLCIPERMVHA